MPGTRESEPKIEVLENSARRKRGTTATHLELAALSSVFLYKIFNKNWFLQVMKTFIVMIECLET